MKRLLLVLLISFATFLAQSQDVNGYWRGSLTFAGGCFAQNNIEFQLKMIGDGIYGSSYHYLDVNNYIRKDASGYWDPEYGKLVVQEGIVTAQELVDRCAICIKRFSLQYRKEGNTEYLDGYWTGKVQGSHLDCGTGGTITLSRIVEPTFKEDIVPVFSIDTGAIELTFYDNATIDGDSISVLVNKNRVLSHERLGGKPVTATIHVTLETPFVEVEMVAENEGSIPPNTALLEITAKNFFHRLHMSSTKEKSAKVRFIYQKQVGKQRPSPTVLITYKPS